MVLKDLIMIKLNRINELIEYNQHTGGLTWKVGYCKKIVAGRAAGCTVDGYVMVGLDGLKIRGHRLAWMCHYGIIPVGDIDHINGNTLDNRIVNLRDVSAAENNKNQRMPKSNTSGFMGVCYYKPNGKWRVKVKSKGVCHHGGYFEDINKANEAAIKLREGLGFHKNHGRK